MLKPIKAKPIDALGKINRIVKITQSDADSAYLTLRKLTAHGNGGFNQRKSASQTFGDMPHEGATDASRSLTQSAEAFEEHHKDVANDSAKNETGQSTEAVKDTKVEGCPVSMVTGEELLSLEDVTLPSALSFTFKRTYRTSAVEQIDGLGFGWSHSLSHQLTFLEGKVFWRNDENATVALPEPSTTRPAIYNLLGSAAIFLGDKPNEYILSSPGSDFLHFERDGDIARLSKISDNYGNCLLVTYDKNKRPQAVINPVGIAFWFNYQDDLISSIELRTFVEDDNGKKQWHTERTLHQYYYDNNQNLISDRNEANEGEDYSYDELHVISLRRMAGGVEFFWDWDGVGKHARCIRHWSNTGYDAQYQWNDDEHSVKVVYSDGSESIYQHDKNAKLLSTVDPDGAKQVKEYDESGNLTLEIDSMGNETRHTYDKAGFRRSTVDADGNVTSFSYLQGKIFKVRKGKASWRFFHNYEGDLTEKKDPAGNTTYYEYNEQGNLSTIKYPDGSEHKLSWNRLGMLIGEVLPDGSSTRYRHDISGRVIYEQSSVGGVTEYQWDKADRLIYLKRANGTSKHFAYNAYGKVTEVLDEHGNKTSYEYGENSHLVSRVINPDGTSLSYRYDNLKNFVSHITNERGETYQIDYFPNGLVSKETTFDGRSLAYTYDLNGKLLSKVETGTNGTELETVFERDSLGRLLVKTLPDGSKIEYQYDKNGNLISVDDGETPLAWRYDIMDRVIESHAGWSSQYYEYDELGLLSKWQLPDANVLEYQRAKGGVLRAINLNDEVLTQHIFQNGLEMMRNQGELKSHFNYDDQGRLVNQSQMLEGREKQRRQYQYDGLGNLVQISDKQRGDTFYDYDPLSRLTAVRGNLDEQFTHDATGNLIPNHISLQSSELFDHAPGNQLKLHGDSHYEYDEFGRLVKESRGKNQSLVTGYEYDCQHRLIRVTMPDGSQAHYRYDAFGRRIEKRVMDKTGLETITEFLWQGDNLIAEMTNSEQYQSYVYEPGTFRPLVLLKGEGKEAEVYHYHLDQIGTPLDITTTQGETVWSVQYRAYGNVFKKTVAEIESPLRFQGQYFDAETGLHYNRHRYYNPNAGRFITIDPIGLAGGLNNYQYVPNPTGWVDPLGLASVEGDCVCSGSAPKINPKTRLPRTKGRWDGQPGNSFWHSHIDEVNEITGGKPIEFVNGRPVFTPWAKGQVMFKPGQLDGSKADFDAVYKYVANQKGLSSPNAAKNYLKEVGLTPHHLDNVTIQFVPTKLHGNIPHIGSASDLRGEF